jgi:fructose-1,6-bisphosphatase I
MAFLMEAAGGLATTGRQRILDVTPAELHQRVPIFIGSRQMVEDVLKCLETVDNQVEAEAPVA